jgi:hypothetical protein
MPILLRCDAPGCTRETVGTLKAMVVSAEKPWWIGTARDGRCVIACKTDHFNLALGWRQPPSTEEAQHDQ